MSGGERELRVVTSQRMGYSCVCVTHLHYLSPACECMCVSFTRKEHVAIKMMKRNVVHDVSSFDPYASMLGLLLLEY